MRLSRKTTAFGLALLLAAGLTGCTLFPAKKNPTLATTTSAEQHERILWQMVEKQKWNQIPGLFSTTLVWNADGKSMSSGQVVPYLQSLGLKDVAISDVSVQPNGPDMTVRYSVQISDAHGAAHTSIALSVWQQLKDGGYILIAHSQQPASGASSASLR